MDGGAPPPSSKRPPPPAAAASMFLSSRGHGIVHEVICKISQRQVWGEVLVRVVTTKSPPEA